MCITSDSADSPEKTDSNRHQFAPHYHTIRKEIVSKKPVILSDSLWTLGHRRAALLDAAQICGVRLNEALGAWATWLRFRKDNDFDRVTSANLTNQPKKLAVTIEEADRMVGLKGFAGAFASVGWLQLTPDGFVLSSAAAIDHRAKVEAKALEKSLKLAADGRKAGSPLSKFRKQTAGK